MKWFLLVPAVILMVLLFLLALLLLLRARVFIQYDQSLTVKAGVGRLLFSLYPARQKKEKPKKREKPKKQNSDNELAGEPLDFVEEDSSLTDGNSARRGSTKQADKPGKKNAETNEENPPQEEKAEKLTLELLRSYVNFGVQSMGRAKKPLRLELVRLHVVVASENPATAALAYGGAAAAISMFLPCLEDHFKVKKEDLSVDVDFESTQGRILFELILTARIGAMLIAGLKILLSFFKLRKEAVQA